LDDTQALILSIVEDIQSDMKALRKTQEELNTKMAVNESRISTLERDVTEHNTRLTLLENKDNKATGILSFFLFVIPTAIAIVSLFF